VKFRGFRVFESIHIIHASYEVPTLRPWEKLEPGLEPARDHFSKSSARAETYRKFTSRLEPTPQSRLEPARAQAYMPPKEAMSQSNLHWRQCGADWYPDGSEFESPPQPLQLPDWACEPKWVFEFQDFIKGPLGYYAWKLATETDPTPHTPVANVLLGLQQMVQGLRDAWGLAGTRQLKLPREVLEWTAECELRSPRLAAVTTSASTQIPPPPRPTVTEDATTKGETSPAPTACDASTDAPPSPPVLAYAEVATQTMPLTAPATSVLTSSDCGALVAGKIDLDLRKTQRPVTGHTAPSTPLAAQPMPGPPDWTVNELSGKKWGPDEGAEISQVLHVPDSESDSKVEKATQAGPAPTVQSGKLRPQPGQPKPVCDCEALSLGKFAQQTAAISGALPKPPPLPVQTAPGSQVPQPPEATPAIQSPQRLATPKPALTKPPPFGASLGPPRVSKGKWMDQQCAVVSELCEAVSVGMRMLNVERVWAIEERDRAEKALILLSEESDKAGKALTLLSEMEDLLKGKEATTNVATRTEKPSTSDAPTGSSVIRTLRSPSPAPPPLPRTREKECFQAQVGWALRGRAEESFEEKRLRDYGHMACAYRTGDRAYAP